MTGWTEKGRDGWKLWNTAEEAEMAGMAEMAEATETVQEKRRGGGARKTTEIAGAAEGTELEWRGSLRIKEGARREQGGRGCDGSASKQTSEVMVASTVFWCGK
jgi:hypothetical protein